MKIYFDTCCYNRPYDDQRQERIHAEAEAIKNIVKLAQWHGYTILGSTTLEKEIGDITNAVKHERTIGLYRQTITYRAKYKKDIFDYFVPILSQAGIDGADVMHLCYSIAAGADYLLTTDDDFMDIAAGLAIPVKVINPLNFPLGGVI
jgi:predicted nucleic acid-binding protein